MVATALPIKCGDCGRFFENFETSAGCPMGHGRLRPLMRADELEQIELSRKPKARWPFMNFIGDNYRRCRRCNRFLANGYDVHWKQKPGARWREFVLMLRCTQCSRDIGAVAKSNMPEDESLIPPKPDIAGQKELFSDAGKSSSGQAHYLSEDTP